MTAGAPKPNSNTTQREERVPLQKTQLHQHVTLNITSQYLGDTKGVQGTKGLDNKRRVVQLRAESKKKLANLYLDQGGRHAREGAAVKQPRSRLA